MNEHVQLEIKRQIWKVATGMLDGSMNYLEGAIALVSLRDEVGAYENDPDFIAFVAVASGIHDLQLGCSREHWSQEAIEQHDLKIKQSIEWAKEFSLENCKSLAKRYHR